MENLDELEVMFQHINVTCLSSVIPGVKKLQLPLKLVTIVIRMKRTNTFHRMQKRKENTKLVRRVEILWLSKCHDLSMCCLLVRAKVNKRLKMIS
jgi:hypothetical protein